MGWWNGQKLKESRNQRGWTEFKTKHVVVTSSLVLTQLEVNPMEDKLQLSVQLVEDPKDNVTQLWG
jgi:hypothetical protein